MGITKTYQAEWNNISLIDISKSLGKTIDEIASVDFYAQFYQNLAGNGWKLQKEWLEEKELLGKLIFLKIHPAISDRIISLGAGMGVCESAAIGGGIT